MSRDLYFRPLIQAICIQSIFLLLSACVLDSEQTFAATRYASLAFWAGVLIVIIRRPAAPTSSDLRFVRYGLIPIVVAAVPCFFIVWHLKGVD
jgi:hypothetical protein